MSIETTQTWESERLAAFNTQYAINGSTLTFNGAEVTCLAPPKEQMKQMAQADYIGRRPATFTIRRSDFSRLNLKLKDRIISCGSTFAIQAIIDDDAEPCVDLRTELLQ